MAISTSTFLFDESDLPASPAWVAEIPVGITSKEKLLEELYQRLRFPEYFGGNWDALWECIRDLSWLPSGPVVLRHNDLPLAGDVESQKIYLSILNDTVNKTMPVPGEHLRDLFVLFPLETQQQIDWLVKSSKRSEADGG